MKCKRIAINTLTSVICTDRYSYAQKFGFRQKRIFQSDSSTEFGSERGYCFVNQLIFKTVEPTF